VAVSAATWNSVRPLSAEQREQVRMHPYYTQRVLGRSPFLRSLSEVASCHHERLDGSGYFRGAAGAALSAPARILAAADACQRVDGELPQDDLHAEEDPGDRRVERGRDAAGRAAGDQDPQPALRHLDPLAHAGRQRRAYLHDRALPADRSAGPDT
jgi:hypothetical protein